MALSPNQAAALLARCGIVRTGEHFPDFHTLGSSQVAALVHWADCHRYRQPANANGSRARSFYSMVERKAAKADQPAADMVTISRAHLAELVEAARIHLEDLSSGLADGTYDDGEETLEPIEAAIAAAKSTLGEA
jgi:hypothetical protein